MILADHPDHGMIREVRIVRSNSLNAPEQWVAIFDDGAAYELNLGRRFGLHNSRPTLDPQRKFNPRGEGGTGN